MERIREELRRLYHHRGELKASMVVEYARDNTTELHGHFEWDDSKAAHEHRLWQARKIIRNVRFIEHDGRRETIVHVPSFSDEREGSYLVACEVISDDEKYSRALHDAMQRLNAASAGVRELQRLRDSDPAKKAIGYISRAKEALEDRPEA